MVAGSTLGTTATTAAPNKHQPPTRALPHPGRAEALFSERLYAREITYIFNGHAWLFAGIARPFDFTGEEMCPAGKALGEKHARQRAEEPRRLA